MKRIACPLLFLSFCLFLPYRAIATESLFKNGLKIGAISYEGCNVFERGTDLDHRFPYSWANWYHVVTKEQFVRREVLFRPGEAFDPDKIQESERWLRSLGIFRYVRITYDEPQNGTVNIHIFTEDVWTTSIQVSYDAIGGKNLYRLGIHEQNFLGQGIRVGGFIRQDIDRFVKGVTYYDPNVFNSPLDFFYGYGKDEEGRQYEIGLVNPFKSVLTGHSEAFSHFVSDDQGRLFEGGDEAVTFAHRERDFRSHAALALNPSIKKVHRVSIAHQYQKDEFFDYVVLLPVPRLPVPSNRVVSAVLVGYEYKRVNYLKKREVLTFDRDEDLNLGWRFLTEAGPSLEALDASQDGTVGRLSFKKTSQWQGQHYNFTNVVLSSRYEKDAVANGVVSFRNHYVNKHWWHRNIATLTLHYRAGKNLDPERQFLLGAENGLRGYSVRQFNGSKKALVTIENKHVLIYDWLQMINLGWALFADTGRTWKKGENPQFKEFKSDVGFGFRMAPSRSVDPSIVRIDLAYALNDNQRSSRWVVNIGGEILFGRREERKFDF